LKRCETPYLIALARVGAEVFGKLEIRSEEGSYYVTLLFA
jgi:hypothetical protein